MNICAITTTSQYCLHSITETPTSHCCKFCAEQIHDKNLGGIQTVDQFKVKKKKRTLVCPKKQL